MKRKLHDVKAFYAPRRNTIFWSVVIALFFIVFIGIVLVWDYLWNYLVEYEKNNSDYIVESYVDLYRNKDYEDILKYQNISYTELNDKKEYEDYLADIVGQDTSCIEALKADKSGQDIIYYLYNNKKKIAEITVSPDGQFNRYGMEGWTISPSIEFKMEHSVKIYTPYSASLYIDDKLVNDSYLTEVIETIDFYDQLDNKDEVPKLKCYYIDNLLNEPELKVHNENGNELDVFPQKGAFYAEEFFTDDLKAVLEPRCEEIARKFALYSILDLKFDDIKDLFYDKSEYYRKIGNFKNDWYKEHTFSYDNVKFRDFILYDPGHAVLTISFSYHVNIGYRVNDYDVEYTMSMIKVDGVWKVAQMIMK